MRHDEEFAKEAFSRFLARVGRPFSWRGGTEPPDYFLETDGTTFAIEITQVVEAVDVGSHTMSYHGMSAALKRLTGRLEDQAKSRGLLHGKHAIALSPIPNLAALEASITEAVLRYLADTQARDATPWTTILSSTDGDAVAIRKLSAAGATIGEMIGSGAKWGPDVVKEANSLIHAAILSKTERLKGLAGDIVLLLVDAYHHAPRDVWQVSVAWPFFLAAPFHTIARVHSEHECQILHSRYEPWLAAA